MVGLDTFSSANVPGVPNNFGGYALARVNDTNEAALASDGPMARRGSIAANYLGVVSGHTDAIQLSGFEPMMHGPDHAPITR
jgi:hypothetical protein